MIHTNPQLLEFLPALQKADWVALDTEADSLHAYPEKLCLIQISITGEDRLIDPLAKIDLAPLWPELRKHELIFNAADYDLRLLRKTYNFVPEKIFDTMLAARLIGEKQFGLNNLVTKFLNVKLEKGSQTADWSKRPLTEKMEAYARNDTHHLKALADILRDKLKEKSRLSWHEETCARLVQECAELPPPPTDRWRIRGSSKLLPLGLAVLRELWHWREKEALAANKPPYFVLAHEVLLDISNAMASEHPVEKLKEFLPRHLSQRRTEELEKAVQRGLSLSAERRPDILQFHTPRPTEAEKRRFEDLKKRCERAGHQHQIDPTLIASRATLGLLAHDWDRHAKELMKWQQELLESKARN